MHAATTEPCNAGEPETDNRDRQWRGDRAKTQTMEQRQRDRHKHGTGLVETPRKALEHDDTIRDLYEVGERNGQACVLVVVAHIIYHFPFIFARIT